MASETGGQHGATVGVWIAVAVIIVGSIVGAVALIEWIWPLFWVGVALMVVGCVMAYFNDIMSMVTEFGGGSSDSEVA